MPDEHPEDLTDPFLPATGMGEETYRVVDHEGVWNPSEAPSIISVPSRQDLEPRRIRQARLNPLGRMEFAYYNSLVFVCSICVMMLELTASRLIAKHVGASLYTWTSVIGIVLAGMTCGNWLGGWLADRYNRTRMLAVALLIGSLSSIAVLILDNLANQWERPSRLGWPAWIVFLVGLMFFVPATAMGACSSLIATIALARSTRLGRTVGHVHAWGAAGSIVGTFVTGFYLIDIWGTRTIVCLIALTLAAMSLIVARAHTVFRAAVLFGWIQLLIAVTLLAAGTRDGFEKVIATASRPFYWRQKELFREMAAHRWTLWGGNVGEHVHELGLAIGLREDQPDDYNDESAYSSIRVGHSVEQGKPVKYLRLDHLVHAYFDPQRPTDLVYEYEKIYAAVTEKTVPPPKLPIVRTIAPFTGEETITEGLPEGVEYDVATHRLTVSRLAADTVSQLKRQSPAYVYQAAIEEAYQRSIAASFAGFLTVALKELPTGVQWPVDLANTIRFDESFGTLAVYQPLSVADRDRLLSLVPSDPWWQAVTTLLDRTDSLNGLFLGGGGFVFPRWFAETFPGATHIDVAELDPAVLKVAEHELGLTGALASRIHTDIGDARNVVDDLLRANRRRKAQQQQPVLYDYIYGDAFNDFGIPWHLSTREFLQKQRELMSTRGILQANIIEIYPRTQYPPATHTVSHVTFIGQLPTRFAGLTLRDNTPASIDSVTGLTIERTGFNTFRFKKAGPVSMEDEAALASADPRPDWKNLMADLAKRSRSQPAIPGFLPAAVEPVSRELQTWQPCPEPYNSLEVYRSDQNQVTIAIRGQLSDATRKLLLQLSSDTEWQWAINDLAQRSRKVVCGRFLGRYVATAMNVFPNVYLYSTTGPPPDDRRDTFVMVCSQQPLDIKGIAASEHWGKRPFAWHEAGNGKNVDSGQMAEVLALSQGQLLTDDFAPVETLLLPVFDGHE